MNAMSKGQIEDGWCMYAHRTAHSKDACELCVCAPIDPSRMNRIT